MPYPDEEKKAHAVQTKALHSKSVKILESMLIVLLLIILYVVVQYANLRMRYQDIYDHYSEIVLRFPNIPINIGPSRVVLGYERPWWSQIVMSQPITQQAADFLLRLIRVQKIPSSLMFVGPAPGAGKAATDALERFIATPKTWVSTSNLLFNRCKIPWNSHLVQSYYNIVKGRPPTAVFGNSYSLLVLWLYGFEEYVRQRFTEAATSVLSEWDYMFATVTAPPPSHGNEADQSCSVANLSSAAISGGAAGAMLGAPVAPPFGAIGGFVAGSVLSLVSKKQCVGN